MNDKKDNDKLSFWPFVLAVPIGIILFKGLPHTDLYKEYAKNRKTINSIVITTKLISNKLKFVVNNKSPYQFKDLVVKCKFLAQSNTILAESEYTIYNTFNKKIKRTVNDFEVNNIPSQTDTTICEAKEVTIIYEEDEKQKRKEKLREILSKHS